MSEHKLSRYGKGKFVYNVDAYAHSVSLDGGADLGESDGPLGCHTRIDGPFEPGKANAWDKTNHDDTLTCADVSFLSRQAGAILHEDSQGFVTVEWFDALREFHNAWVKLEDEHEQADEQAEQEWEN